MHAKTFTILIVDDEMVNRRILQALLVKQGYNVLVAVNGLEGREIAKREIPDIILLDIIMPEEDGFETCRKLKADPVTTDIPIIFVSAMNDVASKVKGLSIGGWDYIAKPFQKDEVLARVKNYLKLRFTFKRIIEEQAQRLRQVQEAQQAILVNPEDLPAADFGVKYVPILEAGGDFYDVFEISESVIGYFVADISGHDLGASFATSALKALIRQNSSLLYAPDETIRMINSILFSIFREGQHLTAVYACLDKHHLKLNIVNAAHLPVLYLPRKKNPQWIMADSDVIGVFENAMYTFREMTVETGDRFYFYSDGLLESFGNSPRTREKGMVELKQAALETREQPIMEATEEIVRKMFSKDKDAEDDVLLLGVDI
ncbi:MAG: fused response regulator/phosphatase [Thermodesulfobacteriota bacterium]|nr:fused response regulator/phosphatase [Thermodesulfobacteriota bacterium]